MLRFLLRALGLILLAGAFVSAVMDGARSIANNDIVLTPLGVTLARAAPLKFAAFAAMSARVHPKLWDPVLIHALYVPTFLALTALGLALMALTERRR